MKKSNILLSLSLVSLGALASCQRIMDPGDSTASLIYVECVQGLSDTTAINVIATAPKFGYGESRSLSSEANVSLKVGGKEISLSRGEVSAPLFPKGAFYTTEKIEGGQSIEVNVSAEGFSPVSATTVKPRSVKPFTTTLSRDVVYGDEYNGDSMGLDVIRMDIIPDDPEMGEHYYMLLFDEMSYDKRREETRYFHPHPVLKDSGFYSSDFGDAEVVTATFSKWSVLGRGFYSSTGSYFNAYLWRGASLAKEGRLTVYFNTGNKDEDISMRATLMYVSPEFYRYAKSVEYNNDDNDILSLFFPSSYAYTNVKGGCGVLGAVSSRVGEWVKL